MPEGEPKPIYVIDSSALIDLRGDFPLPEPTFGRLWQRFTDLAGEGRLIAPDEVRHEIGLRDDDLKTWASSADGLFLAPDEAFMVALTRVVDECGYLVNLGRRFSADAWVVALALQLHEAETFRAPMPRRQSRGTWNGVRPAAYP